LISVEGATVYSIAVVPSLPSFKSGELFLMSPSTSSASAVLQSLEKDLGLALVHIPSGTKGPVHKGWQKKRTRAKEWANGRSECNAGILHHQSKTICFDIDNVSEARSRFPFLKKLIDSSGGSECGLRWTSGVKNRLKILFRLDKALWKKFKVITMPDGIGQIRGGKKCGLQDVVYGLHPTGKEYSFINLPTSKELKLGAGEDILTLPKWLRKKLVSELKTIERGTKAGSHSADVGVGSGYIFIDVYNKWYMEGGGGEGIYSEVLSLGGYEEIGSFCALRRKGSNNKQSVVFYTDSDGIDRCYNFSDTTGDGLLSLGLHDPYSLLETRLGFDKARKYVCSENKELSLLVDMAKGLAGRISGEGSVPVYRLTGIDFDTARNNMPYLSDRVKFPRDLSSGFADLVDCICYHQQGVYNSAMGFWYSLVLADWLIGCGYKSFGGTGCEPIYCFTAGPSGMGKSTTMQAGNMLISYLGGSGNSLDAGANDFSGVSASGFGGDKDKEAYPIINRGFKNKRHLKNIKTAEGLEDLLTSSQSLEEGGLDHGCDVLFTQDEYGLKAGVGSGGSGSGAMDASARTFRATILDYKTLSRYDCVEPRLLASSDVRKKGIRRYCLHFNYFTTTTDETLRGVIGDAEVGSGYLQRFVGGSGIEGLRSRLEVYGARSWSSVKIKKSLVKLLKKIVKQSNKSVGMDRVEGGIPVVVSVEAEKYLDTLFEEIIRKRISAGPRAGGVLEVELVTKMIENIQPLAKILAIFREPAAPKVGLSDVKWAHTLCSCSAMYFKWLLGKLKSMDAERVHVPVPVIIEEKILRYLSTTNSGKGGGVEAGEGEICGVKGVTKRVLIRESGIAHYGAVRYNEVFNALRESGEIVFRKVKSDAGQTKVMVFSC